MWKGITTSGDTYKPWGIEGSAGYNVSNVYYIPSDGVEVIANRTVDYLAVMNITVEEGQEQLLVCPLYHVCASKIRVIYTFHKAIASRSLVSRPYI